MPENPGRRARGPSMRLAGLGVELAATVAGFVFLGLWIDWHYESRPWGILICMGLGLVGGMYNFIRRSLQAFKDQSPPGKGDKDQQP